MKTGSEAPLFRREAAEHRSDRLHGDVSLAPPLSWQAIGFLLLGALVLAVAFFASASYSRVQTAPGTIELDTGVAAIWPSRPGVVSKLMVRDGERVRRGQPLAQIRAEEDMSGGDTTPREVLSALGLQDRTLAAQSSLVLHAAEAERSKIEAEIAGAGAEVGNLDSQIADQRRLVRFSENELDEVGRVAEKGFISRRDVESREARLLERRQRLAELLQSRAGKEASLLEARRTIAQVGASAEAQAAGVESSRAELAQQIARAEAQRGYTITAPVDGRVTALTARVGKRASDEEELMVISPLRGRPRAELRVPSAAVAFLSVGQEVRLAIDAFPYQRFGTVSGRVSSISTTTVRHPTGEQGSASFYLVTAELARPTISAYGRQQPLIPGMTFEARIVVDRRNLFDWLFEPILAVRRR